MYVRKSVLLSFVVLAVAIGWLAKTIAQENSSSPAVSYFEGARIASTLEKSMSTKITEGKAGSGVYTVMMAHRVKAGEVELHTLDSDVFYIVSGNATFVTGGTPVGMKSTAPNEERGQSIIGGETRVLSAGDVITIPNGVPHWFKEVKGSFLYFVVKVR
ncbi:MAG TPA: cupin domain-containing protein [Terriglobia bacterium]|nr:cupin domain-containing protein [Terriglobia bacterium]